MIGLPNLGEIVERNIERVRSYTVEIEERGEDDAREAHVSDLYGCDGQTWARRNGLWLQPFDGPTTVKFALGHAVEAMTVEALRLGLPDGWSLTHGVRVVNHGLTGHLDVLLTEPNGVQHVGEIKSTTFYPVKTAGGGRSRLRPDRAHVSWHYRLQASAYSASFGDNPYCVLIICRESGMAVSHWFDPADLAEDVARRTDEVLRRTDIGVPAPTEEQWHESAVPWIGKTCRYLDCPYHHPNTQAQASA